MLAISVQGCHLNSRNSQRGLGTNAVTNIKYIFCNIYRILAHQSPSMLIWNIPISCPDEHTASWLWIVSFSHELPLESIPTLLLSVGLASQPILQGFWAIQRNLYFISSSTDSVGNPCKHLCYWFSSNLSLCLHDSKKALTRLPGRVLCFYWPVSSSIWLPILSLSSWRKGLSYS